MKIFLDIDDVIFNWHSNYADRFSCKIPTKWDTSKTMTERLAILSKEKDFWMNLTIKNKPNFQPAGFISARGIPKSWTVASLKKNGIPGRSNVHQVHWGQSKIELLKQFGCDIFIDDKYETFKECHDNGIFCLLMDAPHNKRYKTKYRIYDLDIKNIINLWQQLR